MRGLVSLYGCAVCLVALTLMEIMSALPLHPIWCCIHTVDGECSIHWNFKLQTSYTVVGGNTTALMATGAEQVLPASGLLRDGWARHLRCMEMAVAHAARAGWYRWPYEYSLLYGTKVSSYTTCRAFLRVLRASRYLKVRENTSIYIKIHQNYQHFQAQGVCFHRKIVFFRSKLHFET